MKTYPVKTESSRGLENPATERIAATIARGQQVQDLLDAAGTDPGHYEFYVIGNANGEGHQLGLMFQSDTAEQVTGILRDAGWRTEPVASVAVAGSFAVALYPPEGPESGGTGSTTLPN